MIYIIYTASVESNKQIQSPLDLFYLLLINNCNVLMKIK